ncbi:MAG: transglutaminase-like domain-containing protein [Thermoplasmatota archaeon]
MRPTEFLDADHPAVRERTRELMSGLEGAAERARALFYFVRDSIPYRIVYELPGPGYFRASETLRRGHGFCMPKAVLLAALARAAGIPSRLHFADIRNRLLPSTTLERLGTDIMAYHTYVELHIDGNWVKATSSFDIGYCERFGVVPVDFDGRADALLHHLDRRGRTHIEYVADHGARPDFPIHEVAEALRRAYPGLERLTASLFPRGSGGSEPQASGAARSPGGGPEIV